MLVNLENVVKRRSRVTEDLVGEYVEGVVGGGGGGRGDDLADFVLPQLISPSRHSNLVIILNMNITRLWSAVMDKNLT